uniref:Cystatin domain-containing protein n=1 Tax=Otus sunia TaxID=257818 RepID=A0A8C8AG06_9STRI
QPEGGITELSQLPGLPVWVVTNVKPQFESRVNRTYGIFQAIVYRTQVVAGTNYFIKVCMYYRRECSVVKQYSGL